MRLRSASLATGLVLAGRSAAGTENVARADSNPGYLAVPVGTIPRMHGTEKRAPGSMEIPLKNMDFFYAAQIGLGTPPQNITVLLDTGSSELWVNPDCSTAPVLDQEQCALFGRYNPRRSRTPPIGPFGSENITFGDATDPLTLSSVNITYFADRLAFGSLSIKNQTFGVVQQSQRQSQGILGLAPDLTGGFDSEEPYSLVLNSMAKQGVIASRVFSLDLRHSDAKSGALIYGGLDRSKFIGTLEKVPMVNGLQGEPRLAVSLDTLGTTLPQSESYELRGDRANVMLDSGTTISRLRADVAMRIVRRLGGQPDPASKGYFQIPCSSQDRPGSVDFGFGGVTVRVPLKDFIINLGDPNTCLVGVAVTAGQQILGDSVLRAGYFVFDWDNREVHIAQAADCGDTDMVTVGRGKDAVPSVTGNCSGVQLPTSASAPTQTISAGRGGNPTAEATPNEDAASGGSGESGKSDSNNDEKSSGSGRYGVTGSLLGALCAVSMGAMVFTWH